MVTDAQWFITDINADTIAVSKLHFTWPALDAALTDLEGRDGSDKYVFPASKRADVARIIETTERVPRHDRDQEDTEAARYGLVREDDLPRHASHPLGHRTGTVPGGTVYSNDLGDGTVTIYDKS